MSKVPPEKHDPQDLPLELDLKKMIHQKKLEKKALIKVLEFVKSTSSKADTENTSETS